MRERGGRTVAKPIKGTERYILQQAITEQVAPGATIYTDDHRGYARLNWMGYTHESVKPSASEYVRGKSLHQRH